MSDIRPEKGTVIELIERDHIVLKGLIERFAVTGSDEWGEVFRDLAGYLVRHEVAEQEVVYPRLSELAEVSEVVEDCRAEEERAELALIAMEAMSTKTPEFKEAFGKLRDDLLSHIAHEEQVVIPLIRSVRAHDDPQLAGRYEVARTTASGRPDFAVDAESTRPSGPIGHLASLVDRLRRTVRSRTS